jgi:hypothetical protein
MASTWTEKDAGNQRPSRSDTAYSREIGTNNSDGDNGFVFEGQRFDVVANQTGPPFAVAMRATKTDLAYRRNGIPPNLLIA